MSNLHRPRAHAHGHVMSARPALHERPASAVACA